MRLFHLYLRWYVGRHFHGARIVNAQRFPRAVDGPTIIYLNHPSWWDPIACILIAGRFLPGAEHYAPMDEAALRRYRFFAKLGLFPVELNTRRGAMQFIRASTGILSAPNSVLWLTPEGRFVDPRERPLVLKDGLASLLSRLPQATVIPLAIEYVYWDERLPEMLLNCGAPMHLSNPISHSDKSDRVEWNKALKSALSATQQELAMLAMARDPANFEAIVEGRAGVGAMYDLWRRVRSSAAGDRYQAEHGSIHRP